MILTKKYELYDNIVRACKIISHKNPGLKLEVEDYPLICDDIIEVTATFDDASKVGYFMVDEEEITVEHAVTLIMNWVTMNGRRKEPL